jgi:hypothetical protein
MRIIDVPASSTLPELHDLLQVALGWTASHLHQFVTDTATYGPSSEDDDWTEQQDETAVRLTDLPARFRYDYDFGDGWHHDVEVLGAGEDRPGCVYGQGRCPPEDCGGPHGYAELLDVLADPAHEDHALMCQWASPMPDFDLAATDLLVRRTVGGVPGSVRLVLDLLAGGVKLTPGGRLPRSLVRAVQEKRPHWYPVGRPASVEEDLYPLAVLHDMLRHVGLVRLRNGILAPTKAAGDDLEIVRRLRSWFRPGGFSLIVTEVSAATLVVDGPLPLAQLAAAARPRVGHGWSTNGGPITDHDVRQTLQDLSPSLRALDLVETDDRTWRPGPSAQSLLPGATALSAIYGHG